MRKALGCMANLKPCICKQCLEHEVKYNIHDNPTASQMAGLGILERILQGPWFGVPGGGAGCLKEV